MAVLAWLTLVGVAMAVAIGAFLVARSRSAPVDDSFLHFRCPGCKRKLRFRSSQSGHAGQCSRCASKLIFPHAAQASK